MKKLYTLFSFLFVFSIIFAQVPQSFNYQAVVRDASGNPLANQNVAVIISILQGSVDGTEVFTETHNSSTNDFGLINLKIGSINFTDFVIIDWSGGPYFLNISVNGTDFGTSQLLSVPYALYAENVRNIDDADPDSTNELQILSFSNDTIYLSNGGEVFMGGYLDNTDSWVNVGDTLIYSLNRVGVGTNEPSTNLEVNGGLKVGNSGLIINELIELSGLTESTGTRTFISLPNGWTSDNTRILTAELKDKNGTKWNGLGAASGDFEFSYHLDPTEIKIYYFDTDAFHSTPYRIVMIRVK